MHEPALDERLRRLQRIAYGAVASEAERAAAVAELDALRREQAAEAAAHEQAESSPEPPEPVRERTPTGSTRAVSTWIAESDAASVRRFRWAVAAGTAALLIGIGIGWQLGMRTSAPAPSAIGTTAVGELDGFTMPLAETRVPALFAAEPSPADVPEVPVPDEQIPGGDYRLLLSRPDGVSLYVARVDGGEDVCAVVVLPGAFSMSECTHGGEFPEGGLWVEAFQQGDVGLVRGTIHPNGAAELTPSDYVPGPLQVG